jgi:glycosyltransferase involved in cell wall biosynthesis
LENLQRTISKALLVSSRLSVGQINHLVAQYKLFDELGWNPQMLLAKEYHAFIDEFDGMNVSFSPIDDSLLHDGVIVVVHNTFLKDILLLHKIRKQRVRSFFILHEPFAGMPRIMAEGIRQGARASVAYILNGIFCFLVDTVILPSSVAYQTYEEYMKRLNSNFFMFPLVFEKQKIETTPNEREFFSFIGGFGAAHASQKFVEFMRYAAELDESIRFQIITRSQTGVALAQNWITEMIDNQRLIVQDGRPLTGTQMAEAYQKSICVWCAYAANTQSGVVADALRNGAPVIATHVGSMDGCVKDGRNGYFVQSPSDKEDILNAYRRIKQSINVFSQYAYESFLDQFYYRAYRSEALRVFEKECRKN